jgi:hypothetical protein
MVENFVELETKINDAPINEADIMQLVTNSRTGDSTISHWIFQKFPTNENRLLVQCGFQTVSRWALNLLLQKYEVYTVNVAADFYHKLSGMPGIGPLQGHIFERQVLSHLCGIDSGHNFPMRQLTDSKNYTGPVRHFNFHESTISSEITEAVRNKERLLMTPLARNFPAVDFILYDPKDRSSVLTFTCYLYTNNEES